MKKYLVVLLLFFPAVSFGVPSVRMLGTGQPALTAASATSVAKVTPAKSSVESNKAVSVGRLGSLHAKPTKAVINTGVSSSSRFPVITPAHSYNSVAVPQTGGAGSSYTSTNVDVRTIVEEVTRNIEDNYYTKTQIDDLIQGGGTTQEIDPRMFDVVRTSNPATTHGADAPSGFVYIWIEENNH